MPKNNEDLRGILYDFMDGGLAAQSAAAKNLKKMGKNAVDYLINRIGDKKERKTIRLEAARAIVLLGTHGINPLIALLQENDVITRIAAIRALGTIGDERAIPALLEMLHDTEQRIKLATIWALGQLKDERAISPLLSIIEKSYSEQINWGIHIEAIESICKIGEERAIRKSIKSLIPAIYVDDTHIRHVAVTLLQKIKDKVDIEVLEDIFNKKKDNIVRKRIINAMGGMKDPRTVPLLISIIQKEIAPLRASAIEALQKIDTEKAYRWAVQLLSDDDMDVRYSALNVLSELKDKRAVKPLIASLDDALLKKTIETLGEIGDPKAVDSLVPLLENPNPLIRASVVIALGHIDTDSKKPVKPLIKAMHDNDEEVRNLSKHVLEDKAKKMGYASKDDLIKDVEA